jgi:hypothetical protein
VTFTSNALPNDLTTFPDTAVFNFAYYTSTVPNIDFFIAGAFACYHNPAPANVTTFYSFPEKEAYQNFLTCLNVSPQLPELSGTLDCGFCDYVNLNCSGITSSACAQSYYGISTTSSTASTTTAAPTEPPTAYNPVISSIFQTNETDTIGYNISLSTSTEPVDIRVGFSFCTITPAFCTDVYSSIYTLDDALGPPLDGIVTVTSMLDPPQQANFTTIPNGTVFHLSFNNASDFEISLARSYACYNTGIGNVIIDTWLYYSYNNIVDADVFQSCYRAVQFGIWTYGLNCDWCNYQVFYCPDIIINTTVEETCITNYYQPSPVINAIFQDFIPDNVVIDVHESTCGQSIVYVSAQMQMFNWDGSSVTNFGAFYAEEASPQQLPLPLLSTVLAVPISASLNFQTNITGLVFGVNPNRTIAVFTYYADSGALDYVAGAIACNDGTLGTGFNYYSYTNKVELLWFQTNYVTGPADPDILAAGLVFNCAFFNFGALNCALQGLTNAQCVAAYP